LRRAHIDVSSLRTRVHVTEGRNDAGRLRITGGDVALCPQVVAADLPRIGRCLDIFEDFCVVTQSVRGGIDVRVTVESTAAPEVHDEAQRSNPILLEGV
jgi:organic hydroperoxide reductase OsmC/OhrA